MAHRWRLKNKAPPSPFTWVLSIEIRLLGKCSNRQHPIYLFPKKIYFILLFLGACVPVSPSMGTGREHQISCSWRYGLTGAIPVLRRRGEGGKLGTSVDYTPF